MRELVGVWNDLRELVEGLRIQAGILHGLDAIEPVRQRIDLWTDRK